jgi:hypothetical protein
MILATFSVPQVLNYNLSPGETAHPLELVDLKMEAIMWARARERMMMSWMTGTSGIS